jgi:predicted nucleic acid-binding protein
VYVLDTNVISELRKAHSGEADKKVVAWAHSVPSNQLYLSAVTILEIELGILQVQRKDPAQGSMLHIWLTTQVLTAFAKSILPVDAKVAQCCAKLHVPAPRSDRDALIAATALVHGMTVVTRNARNFEPTGVTIINPWGV